MSPQTPWWKNATIYQIYPASYKDSNGDGIGDLPGILGQLDYIQSLGVDAIWICPMYKSPQVDMGYDVADYEDVHGPYGTVADVEAIIAACHERGLRILLDLVINHTSNQHAWFKESRLGKSSPKRDWYIWRPAKYDADGVRRPPNNWRSIFGGSAWEWDEISGEYYLHLFAVEQPDVNWENPETRAAVYESAMEFWLRKGIDGFRVDTVNMYSKDQSFLDAPVIDPNHEHQLDASLFCNGPRIHEFLREMGQILLKYNAVTVGELPCTPEVTDVLKYVSEKEQQLSMVFQFDIVDVGRGKDFPFQTTPRNWTLPELRASVKRTQTLMDGTTDGWSTTFLENHDQARSISRWGSEETPELWAASAKMLAMLVTSLSGTLYIYQGQEIGMVNAPLDWDISEYKDLDSLNYYNYVKKITKNDPVALKATKVAIAHLARDHARIPMQWDSTPNAGFSSEGVKTWMRVHDNYPTLNVEKQNSDPNSVLSFWRDLLRVRRANPNVFAQGVFEDTDPSHGFVFTFEKHSEREKLVVALNFSGEKQSVDLAEHIGSGTPKILAKNYENDALDVLQPYEGRIYLVENISFSSLLERDLVKN
ncbi:Alpha-glucosidase [Penicillium odoratum]|uniref:Alpha-glucosidase n=1 Tax=Penicillium odoratum TaxID=1167516 RepID=UPI0025488B01|nr:Alpha-glucosidase [Penicillium odoratum]KAJ5760216.1 Alpha-glucosidase [Penicillium odoratum]